MAITTSVRKLNRKKMHELKNAHFKMTLESLHFLVYRISKLDKRLKTGAHGPNSFHKYVLFGHPMS